MAEDLRFNFADPALDLSFLAGDGGDTSAKNQAPQRRVQQQILAAHERNKNRIRKRREGAGVADAEAALSATAAQLLRRQKQAERQEKGRERFVAGLRSQQLRQEPHESSDEDGACSRAAFVSQTLAQNAVERYKRLQQDQAAPADGARRRKKKKRRKTLGDSDHLDDAAPLSGVVEDVQTKDGAETHAGASSESGPAKKGRNEIRMPEQPFGKMTHQESSLAASRAFSGEAQGDIGETSRDAEGAVLGKSNVSSEPGDGCQAEGAPTAKDPWCRRNGLTTSGRRIKIKRLLGPDGKVQVRKTKTRSRMKNIKKDTRPEHLKPQHLRANHSRAE